MSKKPIPEALTRALKGNVIERSFAVERANINAEARTVELAFASETPYERYWGIEILDCTPTSMRTGRLRSGANLLCDHNTKDVVGVVESVEIGTDRVGRAVVRFGKSVRAEEVWQDVQGGIRRNVSFGYMIHAAVLVETKDGVETYRVTDFEPFEISLVSVPADASVGVGRSADLPPLQQERDLTLQVTVWSTDGDAAAVEGAAAEEGKKDQATTDTKSIPVILKETTMTATVAERNHPAEITSIASTVPGGADMAMSAIQRGITADDFMKEVIAHMSTKALPTANIGLTEKEIRSFSVLKIARYLANPDAAAYKDMAFERECSDAVSKIIKRSARGVFLPSEIQRRDLVVGTPTAGGNLVATELKMGSFIEMLRNAMVLDKLGVTMLSDLQGNIAIPKQTGGASIYWVAENTAPTESQQTVGQVLMSPKTAGGFTDIGRTLMNQTSLDVEAFVMRDLATSLGLGIQLAAIAGTGASNQPSGLLTRITASVIGGTNGLAPTWDNIIDLETNVANANADVDNMGYLVNAKTRGKLKRTQKFTGTNGDPIWDRNTGEPLNGYRAACSNAVPSNLVKGSSGATCSAILFGNWSDLMIGLWGATDLIRDPYTASSSGGVRIVALQDVDVNVRNTESFATMVDALTV